VPVIVAAGNEHKDAPTVVPATYDEVITVSDFTDVDGKPGWEGVSACTRDSDDTFAPFSNVGRDIDIAAPGVCIRSTWLDGKYRSISGTSMVTPHVTEAAALYIVPESQRYRGRRPRVVGRPGLAPECLSVRLHRGFRYDR
jgi:subtilisin family serine protease